MVRVRTLYVMSVGRLRPLRREYHHPPMPEGTGPPDPTAPPPDPLEYPFDVPPQSFLWSAGQVELLGASVALGEMTVGRQPVLAIGSNASPSQLSRKFGGKLFADPASPDGIIPVLRAVVDGVDVVYGAHLASYGSLPATLLDTPGASAHVFITWLTPLQRGAMDASEGLGHAYQLRVLTAVRCHGEALASAPSYVTVAGVCLLGGRPLGLDAVRVTGSPRRRATQPQAWDQLAADMACDLDGPALSGRVLSSPPWRERVEAHLSRSRRAETHPPPARGGGPDQEAAG
jgi:hypothetical protein